MTGPLDLTDRTVLVTGAAGAIGRAVRGRLQSCGATTVGLDLTAADGVMACDVTDESQLRHAVSTALAAGPITDCVHAAGVLVVGDVASTDLAEVRRVVEVNLLSNFTLARVLLPHLAPSASIVVIASQASFHGGANWSAYCASKAGALSFVQSLASEVGSRGVRVNAVCPSSVESPMMDVAIAQLARIRGCCPDQVREDYVTGNPMGRMATPDDVADACLYLLSPLASFVNGSAVTVDGGEAG